MNVFRPAWVTALLALCVSCQSTVDRSAVKEITDHGTSLTIADEASGSPTPPTTECFWLRNEDFLIRRTDPKPPTGNGANEATSWYFEFSPKALDALQRGGSLDAAELHLNLVQAGRTPFLYIEGLGPYSLMAMVPQQPGVVQTVGIDLSALTDAGGKALSLAALRQQLLALGHLSFRVESQILLHHAELHLSFPK